MDAYEGFQVGDYVVVTNGEYDSFEGSTFVVVALKRNTLGSPLVKVRDIGVPNSTTTFYPHELSYEDGTRPE